MLAKCMENIEKMSAKHRKNVGKKAKKRLQF